MATFCPPEHSHDASGTCYTAHDCRCAPCTTRNRDYGYWWRHMRKAGRPLNSRVDATGTRRRLEALMAFGWNQSQIAAAAGSDQRLISRQMTNRQVTRSTRDRVAAAYETLAATLPPCTTREERYSVTRTKALAKSRGWVPPLAWDDIDNDPHPALVEHVAHATQIDVVAIDLALTGSRSVRLTPAERRACIRHLHDRHWSDPAIATLIGCSDSTVGRIRDELGLPAWDDEEQLVNRAALSA